MDTISAFFTVKNIVEFAVAHGHAAGWIAFWYLAMFLPLFILTFAFYSALINFRNLRDAGTLNDLSPAVIKTIKTILVCGLIFDWALDWFYLTFIFFEWPRELLSTYRVRRLYWHGTGWRNQRARWFSKNYLLPIDPHHLDEDNKVAI
jgi:hypothetical protein